ncbi:MAG: phage terminase large subunit [Bacteroidetes bacterium]|nr:phage terminase large subunit [Bacteroidota bacterium]
MFQEIMTEKQYEIFNEWIEKQPRHLILEGAVRSGKTVFGIMIWSYILSTTKNKLYIMTGQTISSLKRNVLDELSKMYGIDTHLNINNEFSMYGNKVACFGSDKSDSYKTMHGLTAAGWYANEVTLSHQNSVLEAFARCSDPEAKILWETNPDKHTHYIKTDYINRTGSKFKDDTCNILSYHFKLDDNSFLDKNYIESLKQSIPKGTYYDRMIKGLWKASEQRIFDNIEIIQTEPDLRGVSDYCYGLDFGFVDPCALVKVMWIDNEVYISACYQKSGLLPDGVVEMTERYVFDKDRPIYCDHKPDYIKALNDAGFNAIPADKDVELGIRDMQKGKIHLVYDSLLIRQFENYENQKKANGEILDYTPVKIDDHYVDAGRYGKFTHRKNDVYGTEETCKVEVIEEKIKY